MTTRATSGGIALGYREPSLSMVVLRGCECGTPHPQALGLATNACPKCGMPSLPAGSRIEVPAAITGFQPWAIACRASLWIGKQLMILARKVQE